MFHRFVSWWTFRLFWDLFLFRVILQYILLHISLCTCGKVSQVELIGKYFLIFTKCIITELLSKMAPSINPPTNGICVPAASYLPNTLANGFLFLPILQV